MLTSNQLSSPIINKGKIIESPISAFNNIISDISSIISKVIFDNDNLSNNQNDIRLLGTKQTKFIIDNKTAIDSLAIDSQIFFIDKSIHIMSFFKLFIQDNKMFVKVIKPGLDWKEMGILSNIYKNYDLVSQQFFRYIMMYNRITTNFDDVPTELVKQITLGVLKKDFTKTSSYLLPYKNKLSKLEKTVDWSLYSKYEFIIKFKNSKYNKKFSYTIIKVLSSDIQQNNNLESLRYAECDIIKTGDINYTHTGEFLQKLFYYGEIIQPAPAQERIKQKTN